MAAQSAVIYKGACYSPDGKRIALSTESRSPAPPSPLPGQPSSTSTTGAAPPTHSLSDNYIETINTEGSDLKTIAPLDFPADLVGWFVA